MPNKVKEKNAKPVKLLSGGNPQIAKADGDAPVQAYIAAMPASRRFPRSLAARLGTVVDRHVAQSPVPAPTFWEPV